jgi:hypothetical protein
MSMDRLSRLFAGCCLTLALGIVFTGSGCRSMRNDVPKGKPYTTTGDNPASVGFNSDPHPSTSVGNGMYPNTVNPGAGGSVGAQGAGMPQYGTPTPNANPYGAPTANLYRQPATTSGASN